MSCQPMIGVPVLRKGIEMRPSANGQAVGPKRGRRTGNPDRWPELGILPGRWP